MKRTTVHLALGFLAAAMLVTTFGTSFDFDVPLKYQELDVLCSVSGDPCTVDRDCPASETCTGDVSASGNTSMCLPYSITPTDASELVDAVGPTGVISISRWLKASDTLETYVGTTATDFAVYVGEGYRIQVDDTIDGSTYNDNIFTYRTQGDYVSGGVTLYSVGDTLPNGEGTSYSGTNDYCPPYHIKALDAWSLMQEIGSSNVASISRFLRESDTQQTYAGVLPEENFRVDAGRELPDQGYLEGLELRARPALRRNKSELPAPSIRRDHRAASWLWWWN